jgi:hypothetical protein
MFIDSQLLFSDAQAVTATAASTNSVDLGAVRNIGVGEELFVMVSVDVALTDSGSDSSVAVSLEGDSTTTFTPDASQALFTIPALAAAGAVYYARINPDFAANYRYLQLKFTPANGNLTTGSFTAAIVKNIQSAQAYADAITIS